MFESPESSANAIISNIPTNTQINGITVVSVILDGISSAHNNVKLSEMLRFENEIYLIIYGILSVSFCLSENDIPFLRGFG